MIVGTIAYAVKSGLGILAREFYKHGVIKRALIVRHPGFDNLNPSEWYGQNDWYDGHRSFAVRNFLDGLDVLLLFENAMCNTWKVVQTAKERGIKIVMMPMYEYTPMPLPVEADLYLCPSTLDLDYYRNLPAVYVPVPVEVRWRRRETAEVFLHEAGNGGVNFRNGTPELLEAMRHVKSPVKLIVRALSQSTQMRRLFKSNDYNRHDSRIIVEWSDRISWEKLYDEGDVFVFPEKFNGLSLPLQEARAAGMLVMATDRKPMNEWLPRAALIPTAGMKRSRIAVEFDEAVIDPKTIAECIDFWYGKEIGGNSDVGLKWAKEMDWKTLKPNYDIILQGLLKEKLCAL